MLQLRAKKIDRIVIYMEMYVNMYTSRKLHTQKLVAARSIYIFIFTFNGRKSCTYDNFLHTQLVDLNNTYKTI